MAKTLYKSCVSRRKFLKIGLISVATTTVLTTSKLKVLSDFIDSNISNCSKKVLDNRQRKFIVVGKKSLKQRAAAKGLIYGSFPQATSQKFSQESKLQSEIIKDCALMTLGCYWTDLRPSVDSFNFASTDYFVKFAATHKLLLHGHPLVWHEALPQWFSATVTSANAEQILTKHIQAVVGRYAGKMRSWDVINEVIDIGKRRDGLGETPWLKFLGKDYIDFAFRLVAKTDPQAKLIYNEAGMEKDTYRDAAKREAVLNLLQQLKSQETPIYALGIQSHLSGDPQHYNLPKFREFLRQVASLGVKIAISELDVIDQNLPADLRQRDCMVAGLYEDYLATVLDERAVVSVVNWGLSDRYTWIAEFAPRQDRAAVRPLPLDANFNRKLAWNAIARAFDAAPKR